MEFELGVNSIPKFADGIGIDAIVPMTDLGDTQPPIDASYRVLVTFILTSKHVKFHKENMFEQADLAVEFSKLVSW